MRSINSTGLGRPFLTLLQRAAGAAEQKSKQALKMTQTLSQQLQDAEQQIAELQANVRYHEDRADRAEHGFTRCTPR
jgi:hypothetical protein